MYPVTNPNTEKVEAQPQAASVSEVSQTTTAPAEQPIEEWDKERAAATIRKQREEEKELRKQLKELEQLKAEKAKREEAEMTELQRLQKQAEELKAQNAKIQADLLRREVIAEVNLPSIFADRLQGTTKDELLADARKLAELLPKQPTNKPAPTLNATNPANGTQVETEAQKRERLFGKPGDVFSGGGVIWHKPD